MLKHASFARFAQMKIYNTFKEELFQIFKGLTNTEYRRFLNNKTKLQGLKNREKLKEIAFSEKTETAGLSKILEEEEETTSASGSSSSLSREKYLSLRHKI